MPQGELAVVWGVLHHLRDKEKFLQRLDQNYQFIFIREPIRTGSRDLLELGQPLEREKIECLLQGCLPSSKLLYFEDNVLMFRDGPKVYPKSDLTYREKSRLPYWGISFS